MLLVLACLVTSIILIFLWVYILSNDGSTLDEVNVRANFLINGEHAPFYLALDKGYYEDENIDFTLIAGEGSGLTVQLVGTGKETFGLASSEIVLKGRSNGIPVTSFMLINPQSPVNIYSLKGEGIQKPQDLYGKRLGVDLKSNTYIQYLAFANKLNLDRSKIIEVPTTTNVELLIQDSVDAFVHQTHKGPITLRNKGFETEEILFEDYGLHFYGLTIIANEELIEENPDLVERFSRATIKAWEESLEDPQKATKALIKYNPDLDYNTSLQQFLRFVELFDEESIKNQGFGHMTHKEWFDAQEILYELDIIENKIDVNTVFTNRFV